MIILFGKKGWNKTFQEKHMLEASGKEFRYYDIDTPRGKSEIAIRGLSFKEVKSKTPWMIDERKKNV